MKLYEIPIFSSSFRGLEKYQHAVTAGQKGEGEERSGGIISKPKLSIVQIAASCTTSVRDPTSGWSSRRYFFLS